jgi:hypothetical protein
MKYNPLSHWSDKDIWRRIHARELPYHPLHDQGYDSIGCAPCTQPGSGREGRWAGTEKTECGLHLDPAGLDQATRLDEAGLDQAVSLDKAGLDQAARLDPAGLDQAAASSTEIDKSPR